MAETATGGCGGRSRPPRRLAALDARCGGVRRLARALRPGRRRDPPVPRPEVPGRRDRGAPACLVVGSRGNTMRSDRLRRVDEAVREVLSDAVTKELRDPRVGFITVTAVHTSSDLRHARVFVSVLGD